MAFRNTNSPINRQPLPPEGGDQVDPAQVADLQQQIAQNPAVAAQTPVAEAVPQTVAQPQPVAAAQAAAPAPSLNPAPAQVAAQPPAASEQTQSADTGQQPQPSAQQQQDQNQQPQQSDSDQAREQLRDAIQESNEVLATAGTVFPISLFPDIYTIDRAKVTVSKKGFFGTNQVMSMRVEDILSASATAGVLFGNLKITSRIPTNDQGLYDIGPFWKNDALRLKRVTQGYIIAMQKQIDVSALSANELAHMLERLGEDDHPATNTNEPEG